VTLSADAFTTSSTLTLETATWNSPEGRLAGGRNSQTPEQFQLLLTADGCVLQRLVNAERFNLPDVRCRAE
jgi:hypothetical protein